MSEKRVFRISGMRCAACSGNVEKRLKKLSGVESVEVSFTTSLCCLTADEKSVSDELVAETVSKLGFTAEKINEKSSAEPDISESGNREKLSLVLSVCGCVPVVFLSMSHLVPPFLSAALQILFTCLVLFAGRRFFLRGIPALFHGAPDMDTLIACGSGAAVIYSFFLIIRQDMSHLYFDSCVMIITLVSVGKYIEERVCKNTIDAVKSLAALVPETVTLVVDGKIKTVPAKELKKGDVIRVTEGFNIPADGVVESGNGWVDESMFTGESLAVEKCSGSTAVCGTHCTGGTLNIRVNLVGNDTMLSNIIKMVRQAQGTKAPVGRIADTVAGYFACFVLTLSLLTLAGHLFAGADFRTALNFSLAVMVVSCPCALGLATPVALAAGIGRGAKSAILIKSAAALENACRIKRIIFDKTGTLTSSTLQFEKIIVLNGFEENTLLANFICAEAGISHPLAGAAALEAEKRKISSDVKVEALRHVPGQGISCTIDGARWLFGSRRMLEDNGVDVSQLPDAGKYSAVFIACGNVCAGVMLFAGKLKKNAVAAIAELHKMNIECIICSGDRPEAVAAVAEELKADRFYAGLLPQDKLQLAGKLKEQSFLAMVGDGVNDAPALAAADIGIAVGNGSVPAHDAAGIVLAGDDIMAVCRAITLSRKVMRVIKQNLFWAFFYNLFAIPAAAGVFCAVSGCPAFSPAVCAGAMAASSLTVVLNAARLKGVEL